jgi:hypothetical protein
MHHHNRYPFPRAPIVIFRRTQGKEQCSLPCAAGEGWGGGKPDMRAAC